MVRIVYWISGEDRFPFTLMFPMGWEVVLSDSRFGVIQRIQGCVPAHKGMRERIVPLDM